MIKFQNLSRKSRIVFIISLVMVGCLIFLVGTHIFITSKIFSRAYEPDLVISSPDGQYELVVREWNYGMGGGSEIYIRKPGQDKWYSSSKMTQIGTTNTNDGYCSFANGNYLVEWESDKVTIYYYKNVDSENVDEPSTWRGVVSWAIE